MSKRSSLPWYTLLLIVLLCGVIFMTTREGFKTNASSFASDIKNNKQAIVLFYSSTCGYCKQMKPEWESAESQLKPENIASIDCSPSASGNEDPEVTKVKKDYAITGYPTILFFNNGLVQEQYNGERTASAIVEYVNEKISEEAAKPASRGTTTNNISLFG